MAAPARRWPDLPKTGAAVFSDRREGPAEMAADRSAANPQDGAGIPGYSVFSGRIQRLAHGFPGQDLGDLRPDASGAGHRYARWRVGDVGIEWPRTAPVSLV